VIERPRSRSHVKIERRRRNHFERFRTEPPELEIWVWVGGRDGTPATRVSDGHNDLSHVVYGPETSFRLTVGRRDSVGADALRFRAPDSEYEAQESRKSAQAPRRLTDRRSAAGGDLPRSP